jgi:FdrA protein
VNESVEVRRGGYHDSVTLMRVSRLLSERPGVAGAMVAMGTELNREMFGRMGFEVPGEAGPDDLVVAIRVEDGGLDEAREALDGLLREASRPPSGAEVLGAPVPARTTGSAAARTDATVALLSVPGPQVFPEAMDALDAGLNVMIFSDNVPLAQEITLKEAAARRGLIVMGPDCGTAVIGGAGLGFANAVRPGPVGVVAASGTGAQQLMCLLDAAGTGVSHVLGVGGRDLSPEVSGRSALSALAALDADPGTELIVLVSKPPAPQVLDLIREAARRMDTPVLFALPVPGENDLTRAAGEALTALGRAVPEWPRWRSSRRPVRAGGRALPLLGPVWSFPSAARRLARHLDARPNHPRTSSTRMIRPRADAPHQTPRGLPFGQTTANSRQDLGGHRGTSSVKPVRKSEFFSTSSSYRAPQPVRPRP